MNAVFQRMKNAWVRFGEKQGFPIIVTMCVAVLTATALWTRRPSEKPTTPTPPVANLPAAQLMQQSLREAATPSPAPSAAPCRFTAPLSSTTVLTAFSRDTMVEGLPGVWRVHAAVDLACQRGEAVHALADGTVITAGRNQLLGAWLSIGHADGIEALYAGMAMTADYMEGDAVRAGAVIGYGGDAMAEEAALGAHLHLQVTRQGQPIDPLTLIQP